MENKTKSTFLPFSRYTPLFIALLFLHGADHLAGQCGSPDLVPTKQCETAPLICLQNWCYESANDPVTGWNGFCGPNTIVHNPQYYKFIATEEEVIIDIHVDDCDAGQGLQSAILGACPWEITDVLSCDPGEPPGATMYLNAIFEIGEMGWLLIDGSGGSTCSYTITYTQGIYQPELIGEITLVTATPTPTIPGFLGFTVEATPPVAEAHGYAWDREWSNETITSTGNSTLINVPCDIDPGIYTICARAFSGCDTTENEICIEIEIPEQEEIIKSPSTFCPEVFPFMWFNLTITGPGIYTQTFQQPFGCPIDSVWQIDSYPESFMGIIDTAVCDFVFYYEGIQYDDAGMYFLHYPGQGAHGCDSFAELHLALDDLGFFVETICLDSQFNLQPHIIDHYLPNDSIYYSWYDCGYDSLFSTTINFVPDSAGCYCLVLDHGFCSDTVCSTYEANPCETSCTLVHHSGCSQDPVLFTYDGEIQDGSTLHWLIDRPGAPGTYFSEADSLLLSYHVPGCYRASLSIVDSFSTQTCVDSFCIESPASTASLCCSETKCDTCTTLIIELSGASPWTAYISNGETTDTIPGITTSPFLHVVCPPADSTIAYSLQVTDTFNNCPAIITSENPVTVHLSSSPEASIVQVTDTLCANLEGMASYNWFGCQSGENLATSPCFIPGSSGCYCVEIVNAVGCSDTACFDFIISAVQRFQYDSVSISPVPSNGTWEVHLPAHLVPPVKWTLLDLSGKTISIGIMSMLKDIISLDKVPSSGLYILKFTDRLNNTVTAKVVIQSD